LGWVTGQSLLAKGMTLKLAGKKDKTDKAVKMAVTKTRMVKKAVAKTAVVKAAVKPMQMNKVAAAQTGSPMTITPVVVRAALSLSKMP